MVASRTKKIFEYRSREKTSRIRDQWRNDQRKFKNHTLVIQIKGIIIRKIIERNQMTRVQEPEKICIFMQDGGKEKQKKEKVLKIQNTFDA
jgi:hypothetical protein